MIPKNQFTSQPQYAVQINWSHPSARGLIACGLAPVAYDLVRKELFADPKAAGAAPQGPLVPSPRNALGRAGGTGLFPFSYGQGFRLDTNNKLTVLASVVLGGATASQGNAIFAGSAFSSPASADSNGAELFLFNTSQRPILDVNNLRVLNPTSGPQIPLHEQKFVAARIVGGASGTYGVWWDGEQKYSGTHTRSISALPVFYIGVRVDPTLRTPRAFQAYWFWNRDLSDAELATLTQNPWQLFSPAQSTKQFYFVPSTGITGTLNVTEADDTLASTGALAISGSLNVTEEGDSLSSTGALAITGSLAVTEEDDALASTGALAISGSLSVTEDDDTLASSGTSGATGSLNVTEEGDTLTATATVTQLVGGGGMGKQKRQRGWANERARLEASLQTETAAQEVKTATKILRASDSESARRVADLVREYESARATLEQLRDEVERLRIETDRSERLRDEIETAAKVVEIFAQEEAELLEILDIIDEMESRALLIALGIAA